MHFLRARLTDELNERPTGGAPYDGVVHDDDLLTLQYFPDGIELDLDLGHPAGLGGVNERPPHIMVPDQRMLELGARPLGEAERHGVRRVGYGEDTVGAGRRMLGGELAPQRAAHPVHGPVEHGAVGAREVDELEDAATVWPRGEARQLVHVVTLNTDEVPRLELADERRAGDVEGAGFRRDHPAATEAAQGQGPKAARVHDRVQGPPDGDEQGVRALDALERVQQ